MGLSENGEVFKYIANLTFPKFIDRVISQGESGYGIDEHWKSFHDHCNFCGIEYDVIGRMEEFNSYLSYILHESNLTHRIPKDIDTYHIHRSGEHTLASIGAMDKKQKVREYFSALSDNQIMKLYKMYKIDFETFGYDENEYL